MTICSPSALKVTSCSTRWSPSVTASGAVWPARPVERTCTEMAIVLDEGDFGGEDAGDDDVLGAGDAHAVNEERHAVLAGQLRRVDGHHAGVAGAVGDQDHAGEHLAALLTR